MREELVEIKLFIDQNRPLFPAHPHESPEGVRMPFKCRKDATSTE